MRSKFLQTTTDQLGDAQQVYSFRLFFKHGRQCVCCHPMCSRRQTTPFGVICGRTTSRSHAGGRPPSFCGACLICFSREGFSRPFPSSIVKSNFVYPRHNRPPLVGHDVRENPSSCDCAEIRTHVPTSEGFEVTDWINWATGGMYKWPVAIQREMPAKVFSCWTSI